MPGKRVKTGQSGVDRSLETVWQRLDKLEANQVKQVTRHYVGWTLFPLDETDAYNKTGARFISTGVQTVGVPLVEAVGEKLVAVTALVEAPTGTVTLGIRYMTTSGAVVSGAASVVSSGANRQTLSLTNLNSVVAANGRLGHAVSLNFSAASQIAYLVTATYEVSA